MYVYVPVVYWKGEELDAHVLALCTTRSKAVSRLARWLLWRRHIWPAASESGGEVKDEDEYDYAVRTVEAWLRVRRSPRELTEFCDTHGDTYYGQNWDWKIVKKRIS